MAEVRDPKFVIGNATVMLAPYTDDVYALTPDLNSIGMVKSVSMEQSADQIMLKNGIAQLTVDSQKSAVAMSLTFEGYEFSARNAMYSLGLTNTVVKRLRGTLTTAAASASTSFSIVSSPVPGDAASGITAIGDIPIGAVLLIQKASDPANVFVTKTTAVTTGAGPYVATVAALPTGVSFAVGDIVWIMNEIDAGSSRQDQFLCAKIVGTTSTDNEPIVVLFPKVRVMKGFSLSFSETDYSNMPFELTPYVMSKTELVGRTKLVGFDKTLARAYMGG